MVNKEIKDFNIVNSFEDFMKAKKAFSFYQNIEYIKNSLNGSTIYINNIKYCSNYRTKYIIDQILKVHFTSINSYSQSISYYLRYKYNIPVYLSNKLILIQSGSMKNYETFWINYNQVVKISNKIIYFLSGNKISYSNKDSYWFNQIKKVETIAKLFERLRR